MLEKDFKSVVLSVDKMYQFYIEEKVKSNHSLFINHKNELYYSSNKELSMIGKQIEAKKDEYYFLLEKDNKTTQDHNDLSDLEAAIKNFEARKKELQKSDEKVKKIMDYVTFKEIIKRYNTKAAYRIIYGEKLNLLNGLGYLLGKRIERTHSTKTVDWGETNKLRNNDKKAPLPIDEKTGKAKLIYFTDNEYCRVGWEKVHAVKNISAYGFEPAEGQPGKGFKHVFSKMISENPLLKIKFKYYPVDSD